MSDFKTVVIEMLRKEGVVLTGDVDGAFKQGELGLLPAFALCQGNKLGCLTGFEVSG